MSENLGANLFRLYLGGRTYLPEAAGVYADTASALHSSIPGVESLSAALEHDVGRNVVEILTDVQRALARTAINLDRAGTALVQVAERFARTDEETRAEFDRLRTRHRAELADRPPPFTRPVMPGDPPPTHPRGLVRGA